MKLEDYVTSLNPTGYFVLDTKRDGLAFDSSYSRGVSSEGRHDDINYVHYSYDTKRYNLLKEGAVFLYRQPQTASDDKKFFFFGGGFVKEIIVDEDGKAVAKIENGFKLNSEIKQGNLRLERIEWTSKNKKGPNNWRGFWNQYGMNEFTKEEFIAIIGKSRFTRKDEICCPITIENIFN